MSGSRLLIGLAVAAVIGAVVVGLMVIGPPAQERARRLDDRRVADLHRISRAVDLYWTRHDRLPASLDELSGESGMAFNFQDSETGRPYGFLPSSGDAYQLCAEFAAETERDPEARARRSDFWSHGSGRQCFELQAKKVTHRPERQTEAQAN